MSQNWDKARNATGDFFSALGTKTHDLWNNIASIFGSAWTYIQPSLAIIWANVSGWFSNLADSAFNWGENLIQGIINGIGSMLGALGNSAASAAQTVANFLGFHSPAKQGVGAELDIWGPNLVKGFAGGIDKSAPVLRASVDHLMTMATYPIKPSAISVGGTAAMQQNAQSNSGTHTTVVQMDTTEIARMVQNKTNKLALLKLGSKARLAG